MKILTNKKYNEMVKQIKDLNDKVMYLENKNTIINEIKEKNIKLEQERDELIEKNSNLIHENVEYYEKINDKDNLIQKLKSSNGGYRSSAQKNQKKIEELKKKLDEVRKAKIELSREEK